MNLRPERYAPVSEAWVGDHVGERACSEDFAAFGSCAGPDIHDDVGGPHRIFVVLDHDQGIAEVAKRRSVASKRSLSRWCNPIDGSSKM